MAKSFVIECPSCGNYAQAEKTLGWWRKVHCACGEKISVPQLKGAYATRECSVCHNAVLFNQKNGDPVCPVCGDAKGMTIEDVAHRVNCTCPQCGISLTLHKGNKAQCPVCDAEIDVEAAAVLEDIHKKGVASVIKYEGDNRTFIWKHPVEDFNVGSQLIVHESQEAIFFRNGQALDLFPAGRYALETESIPLLNKMYNSMLEPKGVFHSEVYFINMTTQMAIKWGTDSKVRLFDPATGLHMELGASGTFNIRAMDSRRLLLKLVGTEGGLSREQLLAFDSEARSNGYFRSLIMTRVKNCLAQTIKQNQINVLEIDEHLLALSAALQTQINEGLAEYGLIMPEFFVDRIQTPDDDPNYKRLRQQHADLYLRTREQQIGASVAKAEQERLIVEAQTKAQQQIIDAQGKAESYRLQAEAEAKEMQMKGYTYTQETQRQVGLEAMHGGIGGGGQGGSGAGIMGLGVELGMLGTVVGATKEILSPALSGVAGDAPAAPAPTAPTTDADPMAELQQRIAKLELLKGKIPDAMYDKKMQDILDSI